MKKALKNIRNFFENEKVLTLLVAVMLVVVIVLSVIPIMLTQSSFNIFGAGYYSLKIIEIKGDCNDCFDLTPVSDSLIKDKGNIKLKSKKSIDYDSKEARSLVEKYGIKRIPAIIAISSDIDKLSLDSNIFSVYKGYAVFDKGVPYIDLGSGKVKGRVDIKEIYSDCKECTPLSSLQEQIKRDGVKVSNYEYVPDYSDEGKDLIKKNGITFAPALLISKDIEEYWWIFDKIKQSFIEKDDYYLFKAPIPPYKEISTGNIKGRVKITYITNKSCEDCFNVIQLKPDIQRFGVYIESEQYIDINKSEGKNLLKQYNITAIPTVILSKELNDYSTIKEAFEEVGTFESDGKFIFRNLDVLNVKYQKLNE